MFSCNKAKCICIAICKSKEFKLSYLKYCLLLKWSQTSPLHINTTEVKLQWVKTHQAGSGTLQPLCLQQYLNPLLSCLRRSLPSPTSRTCSWGRGPAWARTGLAPVGRDHAPRFWSWEVLLPPARADCSPEAAGSTPGTHRPTSRPAVTAEGRD